MLICRVQLRNTSNALTLRMSSEQIRLQVSPKLTNELFRIKHIQLVNHDHFSTPYMYLQCKKIFLLKLPYFL